MPTTLSFAVLADVHGNSWALEAVLADIRNRPVSRIVQLGDCVYGPLDPGGTADLLMSLGSVGVRGNQDRVLLEPSATPPAVGSTMEFVCSALTPARRQWLANLPPVRRLEEGIFLCHGTPRSDVEYLLEDVHPGGVRLRGSVQLDAELGSLDSMVVLCAHSHVPRTVWSAGRLIVNPGSVGLPAYTDDEPFPHAMEAGSPHARYAVLSLDPVGNGWAVEHVAVPYDWETAAETAARHGRADWEQWLRSGRASAV